VVVHYSAEGLRSRSKGRCAAIGIATWIRIQF
jgi:hypothetical protein